MFLTRSIIKPVIAMRYPLKALLKTLQIFLHVTREIVMVKQFWFVFVKVSINRLHNLMHYFCLFSDCDSFYTPNIKCGTCKSYGTFYFSFDTAI